MRLTPEELQAKLKENSDLRIGKDGLSPVSPAKGEVRQVLISKYWSIRTEYKGNRTLFGRENKTTGGK